MRRARVLRGGGEADLVVDDDVDRAAGAVAAQLGQVQRLGDHALAGERGVAVDEQRQHRVPLELEVDAVLLGPHDALEHRVDRLQVRRVRGHRHRGRVLAVRGGELAGLAQVVLHVAGAVRRLRVEVPLELGEDLLVRLADDVGQHVEPAAVRHADDDLVEPAARPAVCRISSSSGISDSPPSSENRRCPTYLVCRNVSNASAALSRPRMWCCSSAEGLV